MISKPFWVVGFVSLALRATLAQDPTQSRARALQTGV
jgi:hypothetical protein